MGKPKKPVNVGLRIDIETRSRFDLKKTGVYRYVECDDFKVLVISFSKIREYPDGTRKITKPERLDLTNKKAVKAFRKILRNPGFEKHAYNAAFERVALSAWMGMKPHTYLDPGNWHCTAVRANVNGVFGTLDEVARALRTPVKKDAVGRRLINLFSKPDKKKGGRFHDTGPCWCGADHTHDFGLFEDYCDNDVLTEAMVARSLPDVPVDIQRQYEMDQRINDRGIAHDLVLAEQAVAQVEAEKVRVMDDLRLLTGVENPNSPKQMNEWLVTQGYPMASLDKEHREEAMDDPDIPYFVLQALKLKGQASLSSVAKHQAALNTRCSDGRIRGSLQFYGAHTGREAGRGIQPQNLPRYEAPDADRDLLRQGMAGVRAPEIAKGSVRASLVPAPGHVFVVLDYNAIEARTLGWAVGEKWVEAEFRGEGKIYEATAHMMFGVDKAALIASLKACGKCGACDACTTRGQGKVSNLALGYAGGAGALVTMGAASAGIDCGNYLDLNKEWKALGMPGKFHEWETQRHDYPELLRIRDLFRDASPATVSFWKQCGAAWDEAAKGRSVRFGARGQFVMMRDGRHNRLVLPSGRSIWYRFARTIYDDNNPDRVDRRTFIGKSKNVGHTRVDTHGGKLTENINQALARDVLFDLMMKIEAKAAKGYPARLVLHVHDEVVLEVPKKEAQRVLDDVTKMMSTPPDWAPGLPVKGEGAIMERYGK